MRHFLSLLTNFWKPWTISLRASPKSFVLRNAWYLWLICWEPSWQVNLTHNHTLIYDLYLRSMTISQTPSRLIFATHWTVYLMSCRCRSPPFYDLRWHDHKYFFFLSPNRCYQFNSRIIEVYLADIMTWKNWEMITKTRSSPFLICLLKLVSGNMTLSEMTFGWLDPLPP